MKAVLLGTAGSGVSVDTENTAKPQYGHEQPCTTASTREIEDWDIINLTDDGEGRRRWQPQACDCSHLCRWQWLVV